METILLTTDFSENSKQAIRFGYELAKHLNAKVILLNAITIPVVLPQPGLGVWPVENQALLIKDGEMRLNTLKKEIENGVYQHTYRPKITCICKIGLFSDVVTSLYKAHKIDLTVLGAHEGGTLNKFFIGDHCKEIINKKEKPVLIIPKGSLLTKVKKIAFAAEMKNTGKDFDTVCQLIKLARPLHAEILIIHVIKDNEDTKHDEMVLKEFTSDLSNKANYPLIYYKILKNTSVVEGLNWMCVNGQVEMLAMVHGKNNFFNNLFKKSHTIKMTNQIQIPLIVFPN